MSRVRQKESFVHLDRNTGAREHEDVKQALGEFAKTERLTISESIRTLLREGLRQRGYWPPQAPTGGAR